MARDFQVFDIVVPVGGTAALPQIFALNMPARRVVGVEILIPAGVRSVVHFGLGSAGTRVIPSNSGAYITGDNEVIRWPLEGYVDSGSWQLFAYNTGVFSHTLQVRFLLQLVGNQPQVARTFIANSQLVGLS